MEVRGDAQCLLLWQLWQPPLDPTTRSFVFVRANHSLLHFLQFSILLETELFPLFWLRYTPPSLQIVSIILDMNGEKQRKVKRGSAMFVVLNFPMVPTDHLCDCVRMTYCFLWSFPSMMLQLMAALMLMLLYKNLSMMLFWGSLHQKSMFAQITAFFYSSQAWCWSEPTLLEVHE